MRKNMKRKIIYKSIDKIETREEFYTLEERLFPDYNYEFDTIKEEGYYEYGYPIEIEKLKEYINQLKEKGATFISLDFHEDHGTYLLEGLDIQTQIEEDITAKEKKNIINEIMNKEKQLTELSQEVKQLTKDIRSLRDLII